LQVGLSERGYGLRTDALDLGFSGVGLAGEHPGGSQSRDCFSCISLCSCHLSHSY
jgi:hypothetical protein